VLLNPNSRQLVKYICETAPRRLGFLIDSTVRLTKLHAFEDPIEKLLLEDLEDISFYARCLKLGNLGNTQPKFDIEQLEA
jgi:hypothetical protein